MGRGWSAAAPSLDAPHSPHKHTRLCNVVGARLDDLRARVGEVDLLVRRVHAHRNVGHEAEEAEGVDEHVDPQAGLGSGDGVVHDAGEHGDPRESEDAAGDVALRAPRARGAEPAGWASGRDGDAGGVGRGASGWRAPLGAAQQWLVAVWDGPIPPMISQGTYACNPAQQLAPCRRMSKRACMRSQACTCGMPVAPGCA